MARWLCFRQFTAHEWNIKIKQIFTLVFISTLAATASAGPIPDVVLKDAEAYAKLLTEAPELPVGRKLHDEYALWFFQFYCQYLLKHEPKSEQVSIYRLTRDNFGWQLPPRKLTRSSPSMQKMTQPCRK